MDEEPNLEFRQRVFRVYEEFLSSRLGNRPPDIGSFCDIDMRCVVPDYHYDRRRDLLELLGRGLLAYFYLARSTRYFKESGGTLRGMKRILRYREIYRSIRNHGLRWDPADAYSVPWVFASQEGVVRVDGHHRASVARYLGYAKMTVLLFTPLSILQRSDVPVEHHAFLASLHEPVELFADSGTTHMR